MNKKLLIIFCIIALVLCGCGSKKDDGSLSSDWKDMQFTFNDVRYSLPCKLSTMNDVLEIDVSENIQMEFVSINDSNTKVIANGVAEVIGKFKNTESQVTLTVVNDSDETKPLKDCTLAGITIKANISYDKSSSEWSSDAPNIVMAGNGKFDMKISDIKDIYGEPTINETFENKHGVTGSIYYTVTNKGNVTHYLRFNFYKNMLDEIELMCEERIK